MRRKILLFISLVLLAVQGWATPVDSLEAHKLSNLVNGKLLGLNLSEGGIQKFNGANLTKVDHNKGIVNGDIGKAIIDFLKGAIPVIEIEEVDNSVNFNEVTVGTSATKRFKVRAKENITNYRYLLNYDYLFLRLADYEITNVSELGDVANLIDAEMFSTDPTLISLSDIDGEWRVITVTYTPTEEGRHGFVFKAYLERGQSEKTELPAIPTVCGVLILVDSFVC